MAGELAGMLAGTKPVGASSATTVTVPIAFGELIDKITILEIKRARIKDADRLRNVEREYQLLLGLWTSAVPDHPKLSELREALQSVNETIWQIEDDIRDHEWRKDFGPGFIALARGVYHNNDRRAAIKREINHCLNSAIIEEKSYVAYAAV